MNKFIVVQETDPVYIVKSIGKTLVIAVNAILQASVKKYDNKYRIEYIDPITSRTVKMPMRYNKNTWSREEVLEDFIYSYGQKELSRSNMQIYVTYT